MAELPPRAQQIIQAHAGLIVGVVQAIQNRDLLPQIEEALRVTAQNGWTDLVAAIRRVIAGARDRSVFDGLDEEDTVIVEAILRGLQNPASLPDPDAQADPTLAAPGLAHMVHAAATGNVEALQLVANMAEQMTRVGGDMGRVGGIVRRLVDGERDPDVLCKGMTAQGESLVLSIIEELGKLELH
jgi:hypothetical protein